MSRITPFGRRRIDHPMSKWRIGPARRHMHIHATHKINFKNNRILWLQRVPIAIITLRPLRQLRRRMKEVLR